MSMRKHGTVACINQRTRSSLGFRGTSEVTAAAATLHVKFANRVVRHEMGLARGTWTCASFTDPCCWVVLYTQYILLAGVHGVAA